MNDAVNVSDAFELNPYNESFSISAWINANATQNSLGRIFAKLGHSTYPGYSLHIRNSDGKVQACYYSTSGACNDGGTSVVSDANLSGTGWKHIAAVFNKANGSAYLYVDGALQAAVDTGFGSAASVNNTNVSMIGGQYAVSATNAFAGYIDEVRFYKKALTQEEVNGLYSNGRNLLYSVASGNCTYGGGEVQSLAVPFSYPDADGSDSYGTATIRAWRRGTG